MIGMGVKNGAASTAAGERGEGSPRSDRARSQDCSRRICELLDDAVRVTERGSHTVSNATLGEALGVAESRVRAWRDPEDDRPAPLRVLLQLPEHVYRSLIERVETERAAHRRELAPLSPPAAAAVAVSTMGRALADLGVMGVVTYRAWLKSEPPATRCPTCGGVIRS